MAMERNLRIGLVGCGNMGRKHAINCSKIEGVSMVAVVDTDAAKAALLGVSITADVYNNVEKMLTGVSLDAIIVATPPRVRGDIVQLATANRLAPFVEKPIALEMAIAKACCVTVTEASVVSAVGFQLRYSPMTQRARALISGRSVTHVRTACTTPYYLRMNMPLWYLQRAHSGGPLLEQSIHTIDMARYLVGDITHIFARGDRLVHPELDMFDCEDTLVLTYRFANGAIGTHIDSCAMTEFNWEIELFGPNWHLRVDYARSRLSGQLDGEAIDEKYPAYDLHVLEMEAFVKAVSNHGARNSTNGVLSDFVDATKTLAVVLAGDQSLRTGAWEPVRD